MVKCDVWCVVWCSLCGDATLLYTQAMESKLLAGGLNIFDRTNEQERELEQQRQKMIEQKVLSHPQPHPATHHPATPSHTSPSHTQPHITQPHPATHHPATPSHTSPSHTSPNHTQHTQPHPAHPATPGHTGCWGPPLVGMWPLVLCGASCNASY